MDELEEAFNHGEFESIATANRHTLLVFGLDNVRS